MSILDKASLVQIPSGYKSGTLYSIKPNSADGDFTFSRSSSATRVNSEGLIEVAKVLGTTELVTNGNFADTSWWTFESGVSVSNNKANFNTALTNYGIYKTNLLTSNKLYKVQFEITDYTSGGVHFNIGGVVNGSFNSLGVKTLVVNSLSGTNVFGIQSDSGGAVLSITNVSVIEYIENDVPRLDYSDGSCASLLLEPQRSNLITYSEDFSQGIYAKNNTSVTSGFTSPDNTSNAFKLVENTANSTHSIYNNVVNGIGDFTISMFAKSAERSKVRITNGTTSRTATFNLSNATISDEAGVSASMVSFGNGWYRCIISYNTTSVNDEYFNINIANNLGDFVYQGDGSSGLYIYGAQLEQGSYPTTLINTSGSSATRTADVCNNAGTSATFNSTEGVLFAEIAALADDSTYRQISLSDGTATNRISLFYQNTSNQIAVESAGSGTNLGIYNQNLTITNSNKIAVKYKVNDCALWINGVEVATDTSFAAFSSGTFTELSFDKGDGSLDFYGKCKQLITFNEALSNEELSDLTGQVNTSFVQLANFYNYTIL